MAGGAEVPKASLWCGNKPPSVSPLCGKLADDGCFLVGNVSLGEGGCPSVCSLVTSTGCKHYMGLELSRYEKSTKFGSHRSHLISNQVNESSFTDSASYARGILTRYTEEESRWGEWLAQQPVLKL